VLPGGWEYIQEIQPISTRAARKQLRNHFALESFATSKYTGDPFYATGPRSLLAGLAIESTRNETQENT
jgi:hypothetical protein